MRLNKRLRKPDKIWLLVTALIFVLNASALSAGEKKKTAKYVPKDFSIVAETKGFPGAKANMTARLDAPVEAVWKAILDSNTHAGIYPKIKRSFCIIESNAESAKRQKLRNGATVNRQFAKHMCNPLDMRQKGKEWDYYLFQEFDYPFPLADRWIIAKAVNDESKARKGQIFQEGELLYGRQDIYKFKIKLQAHPKHRNQTQFELFVWTDPGGLIADWMVRHATKVIAPKFMEILEREARKRMK